MMNCKNNKGFTLAELLIVVAIIAVLTAVAIPVFGNALEKAKESTDLSNLRAAYAEAVAEMLNSQPTVHTVTLEQSKNGWEAANQDASVGQHAIMDLLPDVVTGEAYVWVESYGELHISQELSDVPAEYREDQ